MKTLLLALAITVPALHAEDPLDRLDQMLTFSLADGNIRARLSGTLDIEGYHIQQPAPGLIFTERNWLMNPRLTFFLDAQFGPYVYVFAQGRIDRGFDPTDGGSESRLDEYALRISPWKDGRLSIQIGKFSTVIGSWIARHGSWENAFITAPSAYENLTGIWDYYAVDSPTTLLYWGHVAKRDSIAEENSDKSLRNPIIWGPAYTSGVSISGRVGHFEYAAEVKNAAPASRPESWDAGEVGFEHPSFAARIGYKPDPAWTFGLSGVSGPYLRPEAAIGLPAGRDIGDYRELILAHDISYAHGHLQLWAEFFATRFEVPTVGHADTFAYYIEAKYKFTPQFFGALRWNQQFYGDIPDGNGGSAKWGQDLARVDVVIGFRPTENTQLKLQYSLEHRDDAARENGSILAAQFTLKF